MDANALRLSAKCRGRILEILGSDRLAGEIANSLESLLPEYDHAPDVDATRAKAQAIKALKSFLACADRHPEIISEWPAFGTYARSMIEQMTTPPFLITVKELIDGEWKQLTPKPGAKAGRPKEERREIIGGMIALAFRRAGITATRGRGGDFAMVYTAVCESLGVSTPDVWDQTTLDDCIRRGARIWEHDRLRDVRARADAQMDEALATFTVRGRRKTRTGKK